MSESAPRWRSVPSTALAWREWDGEFVVWNGYTGSTHLLASEPASVLLALGASTKALNAAELLEALDRDGDAGAKGDFVAAVEAMLVEFSRLGLVEPHRT